MLGTSFPELIFIRICIFLLQYSTVIYLILLLSLVIVIADRLIAIAFLSRLSGPSLVLLSATAIVAVLFCLEIIFGLALYCPHKSRLSRLANYPPPLTLAERRALFARCLANVPDAERYLRWWFLGADASEIRRDNVRDFFAWAFFDGGGDGGVSNGRARENSGKTDEECSEAYDVQAESSGRPQAGVIDHTESMEAELDSFIHQTELALNRRLPTGRGSAKSLRLTIDAVESRYRSVVWYFIVAAVDAATHFILWRAGYQYHAPPLRKSVAVFPPRPQVVLPQVAGFQRHTSASTELGYWLRPHKAHGKLPVVFLHGIGIGLWAYTTFLAEMGQVERDNNGRFRGDTGRAEGQIGVLAIELLPISMRLTSPPLDQTSFLREMQRILAYHGWDKTGFVLVSHSYGSVLTTHMLRSPSIGPLIRSLLLVDPVSLCLHLPDVAYNFTRRKPRRANEWQLWYFASMDLGVAGALGRHFFWQRNAAWKDELTNLDRELDGSAGGVNDAHRLDGRQGGAIGEPSTDGRDDTASTAGDRGGLSDPGPTGGSRKRKVAVSLAGRDLIVDTPTVARYVVCAGDITHCSEDDDRELEQALAHQSSTTGRECRRSYKAPSGIEFLWYPTLDHAQVFDARKDRQRLLDVVRRFSEQTEHH